MIALVTKLRECFSALSATGDGVFARGESDKHVQHCREERSGANFEEYLISIFCTYSSFSQHSYRITSVEWADENLVSCSRTLWLDALLLMDSSYCQSWTSDRLVSLTTRPEAGLIDMWCSGDKSSVACQHCTLPLSPGGMQLSSWCQMWSDDPSYTCQNDCCFIAPGDSSFTSSVYKICKFGFSVFLIVLNKIFYSILLVNVWNQSMAISITVLLHWCGNLIECTHQNGRPVWLANY